MNKALASRTTSSYGISIGTSMALEALFGPAKERYDPPPPVPDRILLNEYDELIINMITLTRNMLSAVETGSLATVTPEMCHEYLKKELDTIFGLCESVMNETAIRLLMPSYTREYTRQSSVNVTLRNDKTAKQKHITSTVDGVAKMFKRDKNGYEIDFIDSDVIGKRDTRSLIITHIPHDLLNHKTFMSLSLLESHTGKLKGRHEWSTKYFPINGVDLSFLPFNKKLLTIFGDKYMYSPMVIGFRRTIVEIGTNCKWNPTTSEDRMVTDFSRHCKEKFLVDLFKKL